MDKIRPIGFLKPHHIDKKWGLDGVGEIWYVNNDKYCLKQLRFAAGMDFSNHMHYVKEETWVVAEGELDMEYYDLANGTKIKKRLVAGDIIHIPPGNPHKLTALTDAIIWEASTPHEDFDSYKIGVGASQR